MGRMLRAALAVGVALRVLLYLSGRSLWLDEARLALNIAGRGYEALLRPLDYDQAAPPLFLWAEKLATQLLGVNELALRALPLGAGIAALFLFARVTRRLAPGWPGVLAVASASVAPALVFYSAELKPYVVDLAIGLLLVEATIAWVERPTGRLARSLPWIGALAVWASAPAAFVLPAAAGAMLLSGRRSLRVTLERMRVMLIAWPVSMLAAYVLLYRTAWQNDYLRWFWSNGFLALSEHHRIARASAAARDVIWGLTIGYYHPPIERSFLPAPLYTLTGHLVAALVVVSLIGAVVLLRAWRPWQSVLLLGPSLALLCASALSLYPLSLRLVLFVAPALYLLLIAGARELLALVARRGRWRAAALAAGAGLGLQLVNSASWVTRASELEDVRPMAKAFMRMHRRSESVYLTTGGLPAWAFYTTDWSRPDRARLARFAALASSGAIAFENEGPRGPRPAGEGATLRYWTGSWIELLGVASGYEGRVATPAKPSMDPGWLRNELSRIAAEGCGRAVWVMASHARAPDLLLLSSLDAAGARTTFRMGWDGTDASLRRLEFDAPRGAACVTAARSVWRGSQGSAWRGSQGSVWRGSYRPDGRSSAARSQPPSRAAASYVLSRKASRVASGSAAVRTAS